MLQDTKSIGRDPLAAHAVPSDFCQVFSREMTSLYLLALMLTTDEQLAERCFASALEDCLKANGVFRNWARTWARRAIVQNAIGMMHVAPEDTQGSSRPPASLDIVRSESDWLMAAVIRLPVFERFVFVMSLLESYSDQECKLLLNCSRHDVLEARAGALVHIGGTAIPLPTRTVRLDRATALQPSSNFISRNYSDQLSNFGGSIRLRDDSGLNSRWA